MKYAKGVSWTDDTRIPFVDEKVPRLNVSYQHKTNNNFGGGNDNRHGTSTQSISEGQGRFTPSLLVCDDMLNDGSVSKSTKVKSPLLDITGGSYNNAKGNTNKITERGVNDKGTNSRFYDLDKWFDKVIDEIR
jgi:hypothetical protein